MSYPGQDDALVPRFGENEPTAGGDLPTKEELLEQPLDEKGAEVEASGMVDLDNANWVLGQRELKKDADMMHGAESSGMTDCFTSFQYNC